MKRKKMKMTLGEKIFVSTNYTLLTIIFIIMIYPILYVISASISDPFAVSSGKMLLWPMGVTFEGYKFIFRYKEVWTGYANTIFYTVTGTVCSLLVTIPCAYVLSRKDVEGRKFIMILFLFTMYFNGGLIPTYLNMNSLGLVNTRAAMILNGMVSVYNLIVARTFFLNSIPYELQEAAYLDGCSNFKLFLKVVIPLSAPILIVQALYYGVAQWNAYFEAMVYLKDRTMFPLQVILKEILTQSRLAAEALLEGGYSSEEIAAYKAMGERADQMKYGIIVIASLPMMIVYPFLQKFFNKGMLVGSVKG